MSERPYIKRDSREKKNFWSFAEDDTFRGTVVDTVKYGDYTINGLEHLIFLERKASIAELVHNMTEKRFDRLLATAQTFKYKFIIIESYYENIFNFPYDEDLPTRIKKKIQVRPGWILSFISKCMLEYGIMVILAGTQKNAEKLAYRILLDIYRKEKDNIIEI